MPNYSRIAVVTGSNKGIGLACVRQLALQYPKSTFNDGPFLIYLTARNNERGEAALKSIHEDQQLKSAKALSGNGGSTDVKFLPLDIDSEQSIQQFCNHVNKEHSDGIDILINNAGIALDGFDASIVKQTLGCNYFGTLMLCKNILPNIRDGGRVVNVASQSGYLRGYSDTMKSRFLNSTKVDEISDLMNEFTKAVEKKQWETEWPTSAYKVSKAGVIGMTQILADEVREKGSNTLINVCCPGYVNTDMTKGRGTKTVDQGAETPIVLALGDLKGQSGKFWVNEKPVSWE